MNLQPETSVLLLLQVHVIQATRKTASQRFVDTYLPISTPSVSEYPSIPFVTHVGVHLVGLVVSTSKGTQTDLRSALESSRVSGTRGWSWTGASTSSFL